MVTKNIYQQYSHMTIAECKKVTKVVNLADSKYCCNIFYLKHCVLNTATNMQLFMRNFQQVHSLMFRGKTPNTEHG